MIKTGVPLNIKETWARRVVFLLNELPSEGGMKVASDLLAQGHDFRRSQGPEPETVWFLGSKQVGITGLCHKLLAWMDQPYTLQHEFGRKARTADDLT